MLVWQVLGAGKITRNHKIGSRVTEERRISRKKLDATQYLHIFTTVERTDHSHHRNAPSDEEDNNLTAKVSKV